MAKVSALFPLAALIPPTLIRDPGPVLDPDSSKLARKTLGGADVLPLYSPPWEFTSGDLLSQAPWEIFTHIKKAGFLCLIP